MLVDVTEPQPLNIEINKEQFGGVWANLARVSHSQFEFTIDFARLDYNDAPPRGVVVSRVNMSPLMVSQLIDALTTNWKAYARKALPKEVYGDDNPDGGSGTDNASGDR